MGQTMQSSNVPENSMSYDINLQTLEQSPDRRNGGDGSPDVIQDHTQTTATNINMATEIDQDLVTIIVPHENIPGLNQNMRYQQDYDQNHSYG